MNLFMTILRILAGIIVLFCLLDYFMDWGLLKPMLPFAMGFLIVYFFASLIQMLIRAKSMASGNQKEPQDPQETKHE